MLTNKDIQYIDSEIERWYTQIPKIAKEQGNSVMIELTLPLRLPSKKYVALELAWEKWKKKWVLLYVGRIPFVEIRQLGQDEYLDLINEARGK